MFLGGFETSEKDHEAYKTLPQFDAKIFPNIQRWANYMKHLNKE